MKKSIYSTDYKFLVSQLKKARKEAGLTQREVAEKLGRTQSYISKVENGDLRVDIIQLREFTGLYRKDIDYFLTK
jgi:transcriptional regulator with XRE-family HTH domain